jgi:hypothetical protein
MGMAEWVVIVSVDDEEDYWNPEKLSDAFRKLTDRPAFSKCEVKVEAHPVERA